jgi:hypothetical protein
VPKNEAARDCRQENWVAWWTKNMLFYKKPDGATGIIALLQWRGLHLAAAPGATAPAVRMIGFSSDGLQS